MEIIHEKIIKAVTYLVISGIVYLCYHLANEYGNKKNFKDVLWQGFLVCAGIALFMAANLGSSSCIDSNQDMYGTTCSEYADDGYEPTTTQREATFFYYLILLYIPAVLGAYHSKNKLSNLEPRP